MGELVWPGKVHTAFAFTFLAVFHLLPGGGYTGISEICRSNSFSKNLAYVIDEYIEVDFRIPPGKIYH
jgi:hypothetical protein